MLVKTLNCSTLISVGSCFILCMLAKYVFTVSSRVWVRNGVEVLRGPRSCCYVVPLFWCGKLQNKLQMTRFLKKGGREITMMSDGTKKESILFVLLTSCPSVLKHNGHFRRITKQMFMWEYEPSMKGNVSTDAENNNTFGHLHLGHSAKSNNFNPLRTDMHPNYMQNFSFQITQNSFSVRKDQSVHAVYGINRYLL